MESAVLMILSGRYIGFLPDHYARDHVQKKRLRPVQEKSIGFFDDFQIALHRRRHNAAGVHLAELGKSIST